MGNKDDIELKEKEIELEELKHKHEMEKLGFIRDTELILMQRNWELNNPPQPAIQQPLYPSYAQPKPDDNVVASMESYGKPKK